MGIDNFNKKRLPPEENLDKENAISENKRLFGTAELRRYEESTDLRAILAKVFTVIIALWLLSVILILVGNNSKYYLTENVLITLLTTTTIQVLGMMAIILWDLFPGINKKGKLGRRNKYISNKIR